MIGTILKLFILGVSIQSFAQVDEKLLCRSWVYVEGKRITACLQVPLGEYKPDHTYITAETYKNDSTSYTIITFKANGGISTKKQYTEAEIKTGAVDTTNVEVVQCTWEVKDKVLYWKDWTEIIRAPDDADNEYAVYAYKIILLTTEKLILERLE